MIGSIAGLLLGIYITYSTLEHSIPSDISTLGKLLVIFPTGLILVYVLAYSWMLIPLQRAEHHTTPRLLEMFKKDPRLGFIHLGLTVLPLTAIAIGLDVTILHVISSAYLVGFWFLLVGVCVDLLIEFLRRILGYLNPFAATKLFREAAVRSIQNNKENDLYDWIDALSEVGNRALDQGGSSLCIEATNELSETLKVFLATSKGIGHIDQEQLSSPSAIDDKITFTLFYLFQRLEVIFNHALEKKSEPACSNVLSVLGKLTIESAKYDMSLASFPLQYIGKLSLQAHQQKLQDIGLKATCLYIEVAKALLTEVNISYQELQEPFFIMIHHMDALAKESFKQNKEIPIRALTQPFYDLKALFSEAPASTHQDAPVIIADIDRVIAEFDALELVLRTIPPLSSFTGDVKAEEDVSLPLPQPLPKPEPEPKPEQSA